MTCNQANFKLSHCTLAVWAAVAALSPLLARAADDGNDSAGQDDDVEVISITGSRVAGRTAADSAAPIDIFDRSQIESHASGDLTEVVRTLVPSFNVPTQPISDGSSFVRPANLRGLPPDETLVLVNGKRFHRSALVQLGGGSLSQGSQAPDISNIPSIALARMEVLRDGASAQYGSDAIAGVINFILRKDEGLDMQAQYGSTAEGDGDEYKLAVNIGLPFTQMGFINISGEATGKDETSRGTQRPDAAGYQQNPAIADDVPDPAMIWGTPRSHARRLFWNGGIDLTPTTQFYAFGNYSNSMSNGSFYYRNLDRSFLQDDAITYDDGSTFSFNEWFPGGFTPRFQADIEDFSQVIGVKGDLPVISDRLSYDVSGSYGWNQIDYTIDNTINPSLGEESPTSFEPGSLKQTEKNINLDLVYALDSVNIAFGGEYREETYEIMAGEQDSWEIGPYSQLGIGSNGFPGYDPTQTGEWTRNNYALYLDTEWDVTMDWMLGAAIRYEDFSDFGSKTNGKLSTRWNVTNDLVLRGTVSTGFRAPTPGQSHTTNVATTFLSDDPTPVAVGTIPPTNAISEFYGATALKPEESNNYSFGLGWTPSNSFTATLDVYQIDVDDRIGMSSMIELSESDRQTMLANGLDRAADFGQIRFFTNAFDTRTRGVDLVTTYNFSSHLGETNVSLAANYNKTDVTKISDDRVVDADRKFDIEHLLPKTRVNLTVKHSIADFDVRLGVRYYGDWSRATDQQYQDFGSEVLVDTEVTYHLTQGWSFTAGANNLFDNYPDRDDYGDSMGQIYPGNSPIGTDGTRWYVRTKYVF